MAQKNSYSNLQAVHTNNKYQNSKIDIRNNTAAYLAANNAYKAQQKEVAKQVAKAANRNYNNPKIKAQAQGSTLYNAYQNNPTEQQLTEYLLNFDLESLNNTLNVLNEVEKNYQNNRIDYSKISTSASGAKNNDYVKKVKEDVFAKAELEERKDGTYAIKNNGVTIGFIAKENVNNNIKNIDELLNNINLRAEKKEENNTKIQVQSLSDRGYPSSHDGIDNNIKNPDEKDKIIVNQDSVAKENERKAREYAKKVEEENAYKQKMYEEIKPFIGSENKFNEFFYKYGFQTDKTYVRWGEVIAKYPEFLEAFMTSYVKTTEICDKNNIIMTGKNPGFSYITEVELQNKLEQLKQEANANNNKEDIAKIADIEQSISKKHIEMSNTDFNNKINNLCAKYPDMNTMKNDGVQYVKRIYGEHINEVEQNGLIVEKLVQDFEQKYQNTMSNGTVQEQEIMMQIKQDLVANGVITN